MAQIYHRLECVPQDRVLYHIPATLQDFIQSLFISTSWNANLKYIYDDYCIHLHQDVICSDLTIHYIKIDNEYNYDKHLFIQSIQ